jgi:RNA polymerase sigma-70 factor, ECF subfamily
MVAGGAEGLQFPQLLHSIRRLGGDQGTPPFIAERVSAVRNGFRGREEERDVSNPSGLSEDELLARASGGDLPAFDAFVRLASPRVFGWMCRAVGPDSAEDLTQEIFLKAFRGLARYRGDAPARAWIAAIAHNTVKNRYRFLGRFRRVFSGSPDDDRAPEVVSGSPGPEENASEGERKSFVSEALRRLPEEYRMPIVLRDLEGWNYDEIAVSLGLPLGTVKSRIARGRGRLKTLLAPLVRKNRP